MIGKEINETGNLEIVIRYTPQDWFEIGLKISALTFIGCITYLFYDWRKSKGYKRARKLEKRFWRHAKILTVKYCKAKIFNSMSITVKFI